MSTKEADKKHFYGLIGAALTGILSNPVNEYGASKAAKLAVVAARTVMQELREEEKED